MIRGIPRVLMRPLRQALLECSEFHYPHQLKAVFAIETLRSWQSSLPLADNVEAQVDLTLAFLMHKRRLGGESALVLFLDVLAERALAQDPDLELGLRLEALASELRWLDRLPDKRPASSAPPISRTGTALEANLATSDPLYITEAEKMLGCARAVGKVSALNHTGGVARYGRVPTGAGWLVAPGLVLTCRHVLAARGPRESQDLQPDDLQAQIANLLITFDYLVAGRGIAYGVAELAHLSSIEADYALLRLADRYDNPLRQLGFLRLDPAVPLTPQTMLYIIQHPLGQPQHVMGGAFASRSPIAQRILYHTPTEPGTSGAPVFNRANWRVVAVHHGEKYGQDLGEGLLIQAVLDDLRTHNPRLHDEILVAQ